MESPQQQTSQMREFSSLVCEIERCAKFWRGNQDSSSALQALDATVSRAARLHNVVGGAFGILNSRRNRFELWRRYRETDNNTLFQYQLPPRDGLIVRYGRDLAAVPDTEDTYSEWMHGLFALQREQQGPVSEIEAAGRVKVPEFLEEFAKPDGRPHLYASHDEIRHRLAQWAAIWGFAARNAHGLGLSVEDQTGRSLFQSSDCLDALSVYDVVRKATALTPAVALSLFQDFPEYQFFVEESDGSDAADASHIERARALVKDLRWKDLVNTFGEAQTLSQLRADMPEGHKLLAMLDLLHKEKAEFPVVPYLLICLVDTRPLHHVVLPLLHSTAFPIDGALENGNRITSDCPLVFVATVATSPNFVIDLDAKDRARQLAPLKLLMRVAAQPLVDCVFYGEMQRKAIEEEARRAERKFQFRATSHELKDLTLLIPKADGKPFMLRMLRDAFFDFSLPATALDEEKHRGLVSPELYGYRGSQDGAAPIACANLYEWILELISLATGIQILATTAKKTVPDDPEFKQWQSFIVRHFELGKELASHCIPGFWVAQVLYGVTVVCVLRNIIKHSFDFDRNPQNLEEFVWSYKWGNEPISITSNNDSLRFQNKCHANDQKMDVHGTLAAIAFYLEQLFRAVGKSDAPYFVNEPRGEHFVCEIPNLEKLLS